MLSRVFLASNSDLEMVQTIAQTRRTKHLLFPHFQIWNPASNSSFVFMLHPPLASWGGPRPHSDPPYFTCIFRAQPVIGVGHHLLRAQGAARNCVQPDFESVKWERWGRGFGEIGLNHDACTQNLTPHVGCVTH